MTEEAMTDPSTPDQPAETESQDPENGLTLKDLSTLKHIIDVASQRGAFKPNEMVAVGQVYNKLDLFLSKIPNQQNS